jgi:hypothetical protein
LSNTRPISLYRNSLLIKSRSVGTARRHILHKDDLACNEQRALAVADPRPEHPQSCCACVPSGSHHAATVNNANYPGKPLAPSPERSEIIGARFLSVEEL